MVFQICQGNARGNSQGTVANDEMHSNHTIIVDVTVWFQICQGNVANDEMRMVVFELPGPRLASSILFDFRLDGLHGILGGLFAPWRAFSM